ncbi:uncharacterized protein LOC143029843 isoform X2 [Oratosquilla oratoria]|uniref:uncharacterized protein LOC143029843 isoform X2 n=1 Tax=Oratosquilla oratoria TaxID=337810 RepID=UPI003F778175
MCFKAIRVSSTHRSAKFTVAMLCLKELWLWWWLWWTLIGKSESAINCSTCEKGNSLVCPDSFDPNHYTVSKSLHRDENWMALRIECKPLINFTDFSFLGDCSFPDVVQVEFRYCPLHNGSYGELLSSIGVEVSNVKGLGLTGEARQRPLQDSLRSWHLHGLDNLNIISINSNSFTAIPSDFFASTPKLEVIALNDNAIQSLPEDLFSFTPNLKKLYIAGFNMSKVPVKLFSGLTDLSYLGIWGNNISKLDPDVFSDVVSLEILDARNNKITNLHENLFVNLTHLESISFSVNRMKSLPSGLFRNNVKLKRIEFSFNNIESLPDNLFNNLSEIEIVRFGNNWLSSLPNKLFESTKTLKNLTLRRNQIDYIPDSAFESLHNLVLLDLQSNKLENISQEAFKNLRKLREVMLNNNSLTSLPIALFGNCVALKRLHVGQNNIQSLDHTVFFATQSELVHVDFSHNNLSFSTIPHWPSPFNSQTKLEVILLSHNRIDSIHTDFTNLMTKLKKLDLSHNNIGSISQWDVSFQSEKVKLDLSHNKIERMDMTSRNILANNNNHTMILSLKGNPLNCDCFMYDAIKMIKDVKSSFKLEIVDVHDVKCTEPPEQKGISLKDVDEDILTCEVNDIRVCPSGCVCKLRSHYKMFFMNCPYQGLTEIPHIPTSIDKLNITIDLANNNLTSLSSLEDPQYTNLVNLSVAYNKLVSINLTSLPPRMVNLDLRGNNLTYINDSFLQILNETQEIQISLGENPWNCDCSVVTNFHNFIQDSFKKIADQRNVLCVGQDTPLIDMTEQHLCSVKMTYLIITVIVIAVILVIFATIGTVGFYNYKQVIKVWLYSHRMCLWAITEDEIDSNKKYDAFLSFSHKDEEFINRILVPGLESGEPRYQLCLHYRDWVPGEFIEDQIMHSVQASRRTIILLSSNFIKSDWGRLEFKAAHCQALKDQINRIIIIVHGAKK